MNTWLAPSMESMGWILLINSLLVLLLIIFLVANFYKLGKLNKRYQKFMSSGFNGKNLEQLIDACLFKSEDANDKYREIKESMTKMESNLLNCIQKIGFVRYAAFENVGSDQSFSIALLDCNDNGLVFSGIHGRETSAVYSKLIEGGKSKYTLTAEEIQAIDRARRAYGERFYQESK